ncbi:glucosamine-6-phosphate deaminase [Sedimentibacter hydroxybenzoicus DSM 7310]|uniref:Glucosamine-6-phosphate deaminase n=1 Tax=Sedimentibacter hydroxybenzoicus DSM 7310 TaxID=1123245 RepID=A0A974GWQ2_SEDHY|nr:glucosamine-6-phosphate deaminase [Sedimentibacter hydroxybenzoicus]NYB74496.1 glucosamine-6-phosphate deaminase [Sedimentibacter hydroxybenzoicus DSM 7310]
MEVIIKNNYQEVSDAAAEYLLNVVKNKPNAVLGLPTGSSPTGMYKIVVDEYKNNNVSFENVKTFNLDEYMGLDRSNDQSYYYFMNENLYSHVNLKPENINIPNGMAKDINQESIRYENKLKAEGPMDIMFLGIGNNGHIGFNEPNEYFEPFTHEVNLTQDTIEANARFFEKIEDVPTKAITMGVKTISSARKIVLIATGSAKATAIAKAVKGKITPQVPASILQMHDDVTVIIDKEAASKL